MHKLTMSIKLVTAFIHLC